MSEGLSFNPLHQKNPDLHKSSEVKAAAERQEQQTGIKLHQPGERLDAWMKTLEKIHIGRDEETSRRIKEVYHKRFLMQPDQVPESHFELQRQIAREQGHGDVSIPEEVRQEMAQTITRDQERSLDAWIDYFSSPDATYPMWFKYYAFTSIAKLAEFDKDKNEFKRRSKSTTAPFPDINREALAYVSDVISRHYNLPGYGKEEEISPETRKLLDQDAGFAKLYAHAIEKIHPASAEELAVTDGHWIKYDRGSDGKVLAQTLQGHGTGWCTAGEGTAQAQLDAGDFFVYYTKNPSGDYSVPRVAIRMQGPKIAEVRGINSNQNLEPALIDIARNKMTELPGADEYERKTADMHALTKLEKKIKSGQDLSRDELRFLYEIDRPIEGFGYEKDPRIKEILLSRINLRADYALIFECSEKQVARFQDEMSQETMVKVGDFISPRTFGKQFPQLKRITGDLIDTGIYSDSLDLGNLERVDGSVTIRSNIDMGQLKSIGGNLRFAYYLAESLGQLQVVGGDVSFEGSKITNLGGLQRIGGTAVFGKSEVTDLGSLTEIGHNAWFGHSKITRLGNLRSIGWEARFQDSSVTDLGELREIGVDADFRRSQIRNLGKLEHIGGYVVHDNAPPLDFSKVKVDGDIF